MDCLALPGYIAPLENVNRQQLYYGMWELSPAGNGHTEVTFSAVSFSKSAIPRFIRDPLIFGRLFNSFLKLKEQASSDEAIKGRSSFDYTQHSLKTYFHEKQDAVENKKSVGENQTDFQHKR